MTALYYRHQKIREPDSRCYRPKVFI